MLKHALIIFLIVIFVFLLGITGIDTMGLMGRPWGGNSGLIDKILLNNALSQTSSERLEKYFQEATHNNQGVGLSREQLLDVAENYAYLDRWHGKQDANYLFTSFLPGVFNIILAYCAALFLFRKFRKPKTPAEI